MYIGGAWAEPYGPGRIDVVNPANDQVIGSVPEGLAADVDRAVAAARAAFPSWAAAPVAERVALLDRVRAALLDRTEEIAALVSAEMGAPLAFARAAQIGMPAKDIDVAARAMEEIAAEDEPAVGASLVVREPVGVVGAITPWNFPLHQIAAKIAPALAAGCTVVLKPSEIAPLNAYALTEIIHAAGAPPGVFNLVTGYGDAVGEAISGHPGIDMISFTGSTRAGRRVAERAAATLKRTALELGGKSANIICADADLDAIIGAVVHQCYANSGQACAALSRLLVPRALLPEVEKRVVAAADAEVVGDPAADGTTMGPVASRAQQERVLAYIRGAVEAGARLLTGGPVPPRTDGAYVTPTVFGGVTPEMSIAQEEVFGPVLAVMAYDTEDEAVAIANGTAYGLAGGVWSADRDRAVRLARRMRTGQVVVNGAPLNLRAPFGGYRQSGIGREYGRAGLEEFFETKSIQGAVAS
ncbi:MAG TPA: aldehyde dehydrogenase family protein [Streptosporangiaceae bacterium]